MEQSHTKTLLTGLAAFCMVLCLTGMPPAHAGQRGPENNPHEPNVSGAESRLLDKAEKLSEDSLTAAIRALSEGTDEESSAALPFAMGVYCWEAEDMEGAAEAFEDSLRLMPRFHRARMNLVRVCFEQEEYRRAARHLVHLVDSDYHDKGRAWKLLGYAHLTAGDNVAAETAYRRAMIYLPDGREVALGLMRSLLNQGRMDAAGGLARRQLRNAPLSRDLWMLLVNTDLVADRQRHAAIKLECARRLGCADAEALLTLGDLLIGQGHPAEAFTRYREAGALRDAPDDRLIDAAESMINLGEVEKTRSLLTMVAKRELTREENLQVLRIRARAAELSHNAQKALRLYERILHMNPLDTRSLMASGNILRRRGHLEEALLRYERAARVDKQVRARALLRQAQVAVEREEYKQAASLLKKSLSIRDQGYVRDYLHEIERLLNRH
jgi:tetratricopeptide (TPR) repeat protein